MAETQETTLDAVLEFVKTTRGFDFTGYKRSSIERRITKRMAEVGVGRCDEYLDYLQLHGEEFHHLFNTILINVTSFFRDPQTWEYLATDLVPQLIDSRAPDSPIRVWSAGCASGEEAYTVAMVLARVLGDEAFCERVKIYATDIDEEALNAARRGAYLPRGVEDVPREALERFFERTDQRYVFRKDLRRCVIFGRNDLVQDAPISHIDLLVCRNTLMYFTAETQGQILRRFNFALDNEGVLMLGRSEMLITHTDIFTPIDLTRRVFRKVLRPALRDRVRAPAIDPGNGASQSVTEDLREAAFGIGSSAQIVLDASGALVMVSEAARRMFGLGENDLGRPIQDMELSYRPIELRRHLDSIAKEPRVVDIASVHWSVGGQDRILDIRITPLLADGLLLGTSVSYAEMTDIHHLKDQLTTSKHELAEAYEELQSTVEELETTNEELHTTNEELETTNEELQSTNQELETMNDELSHRTLELNETNNFLETILTMIGLAVAVVDRNQQIQVWNGKARELWGVTPDEAEGQHLMALDIGLPLDKVRPHVRATLNGSSEREELVVEATTRRGRAFRCRVTFMPLESNSGDGRPGLIMTMEPLAE